MIKYIKLLRVKQYVKNLFMFLPLIFGMHIFNLKALTNVTVGAILFSFACSVIYILNDIKDIEEDKNHPKKSKRPIASGQISIKNAILTALVLFIFSLCGSFMLNLKFGFCVLIYLIMNLLYTYKLKYLPIIDILIISFGFLIRVIAGSFLSNVIPSEYLILMTFLISLFIAFAKRYDDVLLTANGKSTRKNIYGYNKEFIIISMAVIASINIVSYILYTLSDITIEQFGSHYLYLSTIFVVAGFLRYFQITFVGQTSGSPTEILYNDKFIITTIILWLGFFLINIYL